MKTNQELLQELKRLTENYNVLVVPKEKTNGINHIIKKSRGVFTAEGSVYIVLERGDTPERVWDKISRAKNWFPEECIDTYSYLIKELCT